MTIERRNGHQYLPISGVYVDASDNALLFAIEGDEEKPDGRWIPWAVIEDDKIGVDEETVEISVRAWWLTKYDISV